MADKELERVEWSQPFFETVPPIRLEEPLSQILGTQREGDDFIVHYSDCVLLAGHSCPTVSGAYKVTEAALKALYPIEEGKRAQRGGIKVLIKGGPRDMGYGPQSQVITLITGAAGQTGFKGLGQSNSRDGKLFFDKKNPEFNTFIFQREDNLRTVKVTYRPQILKPDPRLSELTPKVTGGRATKEEHEEFISHWQGRVEEILAFDTDDLSGKPEGPAEEEADLITVEVLEDFTFPHLSDY